MNKPSESSTVESMIRLTDKEFNDIVSYMHQRYGINLSHKRQLIESRMHNLLREQGIKNYTDYLALLMKNKNDEVTDMLNRLTTNHTYFMREPAHYDYMQKVILPHHEKNNSSHVLRIWSAGCSSGEEAYTTIMVMRDYFGPRSNLWDYKIFATDISAKVLATATEGIYSEEGLRQAPPAWKTKYFNTLGGGLYELKPDIKREVIFRTFNLMDPFQYKKPYDLIFCRNVMIYFDQNTKNQLAQKFHDALYPGGHLFIGHSESIPRGVSPLKYIQPAIYQRGL